MSKLTIVALLSLGFLHALGQNYTSYLTGSTTDLSTSPQGGIVLMGGATEEDEAMKWFLNRADGGDVLVLRSSGSDGYNDYFYTQLGVSVNSVETIVFNDASASNEAYIQQKIIQAEAIWFAGGDQWDYVSYWQGSPVEISINQAVNQGAVIGGTSAGMAILGGVRFTAENGTVTSVTALSNPYDANITVENSPFISSLGILENTITDTHYDNPDRKGRHITFLAKMFVDSGTSISGIACDEYTAVCIDDNGVAHVFGQYPNYDDNAYFLRPNCALINPTPENCSSGNPLTWNHNGAAVTVYAVKGTLAGTNTFDLNDWETGSGGEWQHWSVANGVLNETAAGAPNCANVSLTELEASLRILPNPTQDFAEIECNESSYTVSVFDTRGNLIQSYSNSPKQMDLRSFDAGNYVLEVTAESGNTYRSLVLKTE